MQSRKRIIIGFLLSVLLIISGCTKPGDSGGSGTGPSATPQSTQGAGASSGPDLKLKQMTKFNVGSAALSTQDITVVFVGINKGIYKKYNLDVNIKGVEGGVVALRGLQAGDFDVTFGLPENVISGVSQGADMKIIGATAAESLFSVFVSKDIEKIQDLKGKKAAVLQPNNGTDIQMRWWLKKNGLEPDKDVTIVSAGATPARFAALKTGQVSVAPLVPPIDAEAEKDGFKRIADIRDDIPGINHDVIATTGKTIREKPEVLKAFIAATSEAIKFVKDPANFDESVKVGVEDLGFGQEITKKGLQYVLPTIPDGAKFNKKGIEWSIQTAKDVGVLDKSFTIDKVIDESFYAK
jgi:NitT/TauT family transport system substrate-binding protein